MYHKEFFIFDGGKPIRAIIRNYTLQDFKDLIQIQQESFPPPFPSELWWNEEQLLNHVTLFPEGALCVEVDGQILGSMTALIVNYDATHTKHTWSEMTDDGYIRNHNPNGNTMYLVDLCIKPAYRKLGLAKCLMQSMSEVTIHLGLERMTGACRLPLYYKVANELTAEQYLQKVVAGDIADPIITFMMRSGLTPLGIIANYIEDEESCDNGALVEWKNPFL